MSATIMEPSLLSSHSISRTVSDQRCIYASCNTTATDRPEAILTVQGEGIQIVDLISLHTASSQAVEPSTHLTAPAISRLETSADGTQHRAVYVASQHPSTSTSQIDEFRISKWSQEASDELGRGFHKVQEAMMPWKIDYMYCHDIFPDQILAISATGDIMTLDRELCPRNASPNPNQRTTRSQTFVFERHTCSFKLYPDIPQQSILIFDALVHSSEFILQSTIVLNDGKVERLADKTLSLDAEILDVTMDNSGHMSILLESGVWSSYQIQFSSKSLLDMSPLRSPITLKVDALAVDGLCLTKESVSLTPLMSNRVMMVCVACTERPQLRLVLWDLQYSVVLASHDFPLPHSSGISFSKELKIATTSISSMSGHCLVLLEASNEDKPAKTSATKTLSLVVPFSVSVSSNVAMALNCLPETSKWCFSAHSSSQTKAEEIRQNLLQKIRSYVDKGDAARATELFFKWIASADSKDEEQNDNFTTELSSQTAAIGTKTHVDTAQELKKKEIKTAVCPYAFTSELIQIILSPQLKSEDYAKILNYVLERQLVSQNMLLGGVSNSLLARGDWNAIEIVLKTVTDISEIDIAAILHQLVTDSEQSSDGNAMDIDEKRNRNAKKILPRILSRCLRYPSSPKSLRQAFHMKFKDVRHVLPLLHITDQWLESWTSRGCFIDFNGDLDDPKSLMDPRVLSKKVERKSGMPPVDKILSFIQCLLDTFFVALVQHKEAGPVLKSLRNKVEPDIELHRQLEFLRGPLEPFTHVIGPLQETDNAKPKKRTITSSVSAVPIKAYQIEEIFL